LGDILIHVDRPDGDTGQSRTASYRLDDHGTHGPCTVVEMPGGSADSGTESTDDSAGRRTAGRRFVRYLTTAPKLVAGAVQEKVDGFRREAFPSARKLLDSFRHRSAGHEALAPAYLGVKDVFDAVARLAFAPAPGAEGTLMARLQRDSSAPGLQVLACAERLVAEMVAMTTRLGELATAGSAAIQVTGRTPVRGVIEDMETIWTRFGGGTRTREVAQRLRDLHTTGREFPYPPDKERRTKQEHALVAARMAHITRTLAELGDVAACADTEKAQRLAALMAEHDRHQVKRITDLGFTGFGELEGAYTARRRLTAALLPTSPVFSRIAESLSDASDHSMIQAIADLQAGNATQPEELARQLVAELKRKLVRHLLNAGRREVTTVQVTHSGGIDALGAFFKKADMALDLTSTIHIQSQVEFVSEGDNVTLSLSRHRAVDSSVGIGMNVPTFKVMQLGGEASGGYVHVNEHGGQVVLPRERLAAMVDALLDRDLGLVDFLEFGKHAHQVSGTRRSGKGGASGSFGTSSLYSLVTGDDGEGTNDADGKAAVSAKGPGASLSFGGSMQTSKQVSGAGSRHSRVTSVETSASFRSGRLATSADGTVDDTGDQLATGSGANLLPANQTLSQSERAVDIRLKEWAVPERVTVNDLAELLDAARDAFPSHAEAFANTLQALNAGNPDIAAHLDGIASTLSKWNAKDGPVGAKRAFKEEIQRLSLRHQIAMKNRESFASAELEITVSSVDRLAAVAPHLHASLLKGLDRIPELRTYLFHAQRLENAKIRVSAELLPAVELKAQRDILAGDLTREGVQAICNQLKNWRLAGLKVVSESKNEDHSTFAPLLISVGGGGGISRQGNEGSLQFTHDRQGIAAVAASENLATDRNRGSLDHRMRRALNQVPITLSDVGPRPTVTIQPHRRRSTLTIDSPRASSSAFLAGFQQPLVQSPTEMEGRDFEGSPLRERWNG
jgi:hypothetical protein